MSMRVDNTILGPARGAPHDVHAWCAEHGRAIDLFLGDYIAEIFRLCPLVGFDASILISQSAHECFNPDTGKPWDSYWYRERGNVAGLGITGSPDQNAASGTWESGTDAARAQIVHMAIYVREALPDALLPYRAIDPRAYAIYDAGYAGTVRTIRDLTGKWAVDPDYHTKLVAKGNAIFGDSLEHQEGPDMADIQFGNVPHPPFEDRIVWANTAWNDLGPRTIVGCVRHTMVGTLAGSYGWINGGGGSAGALWDYSVGGSTDGANDGVIWRHNDPLGRRAGWANGGSDDLEGDGPLFVRTLGVNAINRDLVSIERSDGGNIHTPMSPKQKESIARIEAYWFDQAKVPWDQYPYNPHTKCVTDLFHLEFARKGCPHDAVINEINEQQDRTRAILKAAQTGHADETEPPPKPIEPDHGKYPPGIDKVLAEEWFGVGELHYEDGSTGHFKFHEGRAWAEAWVARGSEEATFPEVEGLWQFRDSETTLRQIMRWQNGWTLIRLNEKQGWSWA